MTTSASHAQFLNAITPKYILFFIPRYYMSYIAVDFAILNQKHIIYIDLITNILLIEEGLT